MIHFDTNEYVIWDERTNTRNALSLMLRYSSRILRLRSGTLVSDLSDSFYQFKRGKKWKPDSDDVQDHEVGALFSRQIPRSSSQNFGFYLKRWRRRKIRNILEKDHSSPVNGFHLPSEEPVSLDSYDR